MHRAINKVFNLINKTGDRCVVLSPDSDGAYVVMSLAQYERMAMAKQDFTDLSEDQFLDKINRDIAVWKSQQEQDQHEHLLEEAQAQDQQHHDNGFYDIMANTSENQSDYSDFSEDLEEEDFEEEPYYFEKV
jgi:PHD/YefM family antitoxin component YafN of YafNO toxin-antitoxin module